MWDKIVAFFMSIIYFIAGLLGFPCAKNCYEYRDLAYGTHERQILDLNIPKENDGQIGLILYIHGGAWVAGDKDGYEETIEYMSETYGYACAAINYRYIDAETHFEDIMNDIDLALAKIKEIGKEVDVNINKVLLTGGSAGGHLSLLYAYSRAKTAPITPAAVVSDCGPTDLTDSNFYINNALGDEEFVCDIFSYGCGFDFDYAQRADAQQALLEASPLYYVNENTVPTVINHGMKDSIVPYSNAVSLDAKLTEYGITHYLNAFPNSDHDLGSDSENRELGNKLLLEYADEYLN